MNRETSIETDSCLLIFDPHQNVEWVRSVLEKGAGRFTHLVLGGDFFDSFPGERVAGAGEVCAFLAELDERFGEGLTVLLGNHDLAYLEAIRRRVAGGRLEARRYRCSGYSGERAGMIAGALGDAFWNGCRLFQYVNGVLVSHAGVAERFWYPDLPLDEALRALEADCARALDTVATETSPLLDAGYTRGAGLRSGGLTWLDFNSEFDDTGVTPPQVFGHTACIRGKPRERARRKGRSWCLDGHQTCYGLLDRGGRIRVGAA